MRSPKELLNQILQASEDAEKYEERLGTEEKSERRFIKSLENGRPDNKDIYNAIEELSREAKIAEQIAEKLGEISKDEIQLSEIESQSYFKEHISQVENRSKNFDELANGFFQLLCELDNERQELEKYLESKEIEKSKNFVESKNTIVDLKERFDSIKNNKGISRRDFVETLGALGLASLGTPKKHQSVEVVRSSAKIFELYNERIENLTNHYSFNLSLPIAMGERHFPPGASFATLHKLIKNKDVEKIGFEFLHYGSKEVEKFNNGVLSPEELARYYINRSRYPNYIGQIADTFRLAREKGIEIRGLEYNEVKRFDEWRNNYFNQLERSEAMVEIVKQINDGKSVFLAGSTHVDRRMSINSQLLKNAHPDVATNINPKEAIEDPYIYRDKDKFEVLNSESRGNKRDVKRMFDNPNKYTFTGAIKSMTGLCSTHPGAERHKLNKSGIEFLEKSRLYQNNETDIINKKEQKANQIIDRIENLTANGPYKTKSSNDGYYIYMEETPKGRKFTEPDGWEEIEERIN